MDLFYPKQNLAMETELEQEGTDNAWRTADIRIRKTQVSFFLLFDFHVVF
jgi:hypothetical protein